MQKMTPVSVLDATPDQRRWFATQFLGLDLEPGDNDDAIFAKITAANGNSETIYIPVDEPAPAAQEGAPPPRVPGAQQVAQPVERMQGGLGRDDPKVSIQINNEERNGQVYSRDVEVGVNGTVWQIKRGKPVDIPLRVFEALKLAVRDVITHDPNTSEEVHMDAPSVPYSVLSMPSQEEIAAWRERTDAAFCP